MKLNIKLLPVLFVVLVSCLHYSCLSADNGEMTERDQVSRETIRLLAASAQGDVKEMDAAIKAGADINGANGVGVPLVAAASRGNVEAVKFLLDKGAKIDSRDTDGMTALMMATLSGSEETVRYLLARGANPNASTTIGVRTSKITALSLARSKNNETLVKLLRDAGAQE